MTVLWWTIEQTKTVCSSGLEWIVFLACGEAGYKIFLSDTAKVTCDHRTQSTEPPTLLHCCCTKSRSPVYSKFGEARLGAGKSDVAVVVVNSPAVVMMSPRCSCYREPGCLLIPRLLILNVLGPNRTRIHAALPRSLINAQMKPRRWR